MAKPTSAPFFEMDINKLLAEYKVPGVDFEALAAAQRRNIEALTAANQLAFEGMQAVVRRQTEILRQTMEEASAAVAELTSVGAPEEKAAKQAELVKVAFEKALANMKELAEMVAKSNTEASEIVAKRVSESLDEVKSLIATTKK